MIIGTHFLLYSTDSEADRAFLHDTLGFPAVDAGEGWLIMKLPPAEIGVHPGAKNFTLNEGGYSMYAPILYFLCDDLKATMAELKTKKVKCDKPQKAPWGTFTTFKLPSGGSVGLYEPSHPLAIRKRAKARST